MVLVKIRLANKLFFQVHHACATFNIQNHKSDGRALNLGTYVCSFSIQFWEITLYLFEIQSKVINVGSDTFGNPIFQKASQN